MEATSLGAADPAVTDQTTDHPHKAPADANQERGQARAGLHRLMDLADRYARRLVAAADTPIDVLLIAHHSDLEILTLNGRNSDPGAVRRLLAGRQASSAVHLVNLDLAPGGQRDHLLALFGETNDGIHDERHYRVRACGRTRRLTRLLDHEVSDGSSWTRPLFMSPGSIASTPACQQ